MLAVSEATFQGPDAALVRAAAKGDRAAFGRLYDVYARMVHAMLLARVNPGDVDDLLQDVFLQALKQLPKLREPEAFGGWLAAITRHRALDHVRRKHPTEPLPDVAGRAPVSAESIAAWEAIRTLPETYRETLLMRLVHGLTGPEIAALTGMTHDSVRVHLSRGMKLLRSRLGDRS